MIGSINENDLITLDDENKYFIIHTLDSFNTKYHLLIRFLEDKEEFDFDDIAFVKETDENGDIYLDPVTDPAIIKELGAEAIMSESLELDPSMAEEFEKAINAITNKDSQ